MTDNVKFLRDADMIYRLPEWATDERGADGFEWRMYWLIGQLAGDYAVATMKAASPAERDWNHFREVLLDRLMRELSKRLPSLDAQTELHAHLDRVTDGMAVEVSTATEP